MQNIEIRNIREFRIIIYKLQNKEGEYMDGNRAVGRPLKYGSAKEMQEKIDLYFSECDKSKGPYTVTGLALALDMSRQDLINYSSKDEFFDTIKRAKMKVEEYLEKRLINDSSCSGIIFNLKNNYGWKDKTEVDASVNTQIKVSLIDD